MVSRTRKFLGRVLGRIFYWIGWGLAILVIAQAIILAIATGGPIVPLLLSGAGLLVWLTGLATRYVLADWGDHKSDAFGSTLRRRGASWFVAISLVALCGFAIFFEFLPSASNDSGGPLSVHFSWAGIPACGSISPAFALGNVPAGTKSLSFMMIDLNVPTFHHGGSTIPYTANAVRQGAISYTGPCPPSGQSHLYRWTVQALDAGGKVLGSGSAEAKFPL